MGNARVARDYYGILGVASDAGPDEIKRAYRKLARELHPDVNPDPAAQQSFKEVSAAYEVLSDPEKRQIVDLGGDPLGNGGARRGAVADPFGGFGLGDIMDAFFGGGRRRRSRRGPRSRVQQGDDALIRMQLTLEECATGVTKDLAVDTAVAVHRVPRLRLRRRHQPGHLRHLQGPRRGAAACSARFLGQVVTVPAVPGLPRLRRGHPRPVPAVQRRRPGAARGAPSAGQHPGRRRRRHPGPAGRPGRGRPGRRRARRPVRRGPGAAARASSPGTASTCTAPCTSR